MFKRHPKLRHIERHQRRIVSLLSSINQPLVAAEDHPAETTQAYICTLLDRQSRPETFIYLHLLESNQSILYGSSIAMTGDMDRAQVEMDAIDFVESLGFIMDEANLAPQVENGTLASTLPIFMSDLSRLVQVGAIVGESAKREPKAPTENSRPAAVHETDGIPFSRDDIVRLVTRLFVSM